MKSYMIISNEDVASTQLNYCVIDDIIVLHANSIEDLHHQIAEKIKGMQNCNYQVIELSQSTLNTFNEEIDDIDDYIQLLQTIFTKTQADLFNLYSLIDSFEKRILIFKN